MRILLLNQFFWPEAAATSQLLTDVARELSSRGHEVHAIAGGQGYAIPDTTDRPNVTIHQVRSSRFKRGLLGRVGSYASFFLGCLWTGSRVPRPDVVVTLTTPPLLSTVGRFLQAFRKSRHIVWEMDVYPDVAIDLGYVEAGSLPDKVVGAIADYTRRHADGIIVLGQCMRERMKRRGIPSDKISVAENWADSRIITPVSWPSEVPFTILYSGNLGLAHDIETVSGALLALKDDARYKFVFAGSGARRIKLEEFCDTHSISNIEFRPYSPKASLGESLGSGHVGLITQQSSCLGSVVPSKAYGLMAAGRPILYIGPRESTVAQLIERFDCGWQVECGDVNGLLAILRHLQSNPSLTRIAGSQARRAFLANYDLPFGVARICEVLVPTAVDQQTGLEPLESAGLSSVLEEERLAKTY